MSTSIVPGSVVVGVDGSPSSDLAVQWAARHAVRVGRPMAVLHATPAGTEGDASGVVYAAADLAREAEPQVEVRRVVRLGYPTDALVRAADSASLVVVGARSRRAVPAHLLGSVSQALVTRGHGALVVVRPGPDPVEEARPVVVGVDGTAASAGAVEFAFAQASFHDVPLTIAHVDWDPLPYSAAVEASATEEEVAAEHEADALAVAETVAGLGEKYPDVVVHEVYEKGDPARVLVAMSATASLVVVGSHGHHAPTSLLVGSVGRRVVAHARCPVAVLRR